MWGSPTSMVLSWSSNAAGNHLTLFSLNSSHSLWGGCSRIWYDFFSFFSLSRRFSEGVSARSRVLYLCGLFPAPGPPPENNMPLKIADQHEILLILHYIALKYKPKGVRSQAIGSGIKYTACIKPLTEFERIVVKRAHPVPLYIELIKDRNNGDYQYTRVYTI